MFREVKSLTRPTVTPSKRLSRQPGCLSLPAGNKLPLVEQVNIMLGARSPTAAQQPPAARNHLLPIAGALPARLRPFSSLPLLTGNGPPPVPPLHPRPPSGRSRTSLWLCLLCGPLCSGAVGGGWCPRPLEALLVCWGWQRELGVTSSGQFSCLLWIHPLR